MSKKTPSSQPFVVATPGQPSAATLARLKTIGEHLSDEQLASALRQVEERRTHFQMAAIETGLLLLAKKASLKHGQWLPWLQKFAKNQICSALHISNSGTRSLNDYCYLAQHFLADLEQQNFQPDGKDDTVTPPAVAPAEVLALPNLPQERGIAVRNAIGQFIAGRSLRRMLTDLRRAEVAADQEACEEANRKRKKPTASSAEATGQLDFWDEMNRPLGEIDTLMKSEDFVERTTKQGWIQLADALLTKSKEARALAAKMA